jgi:hypothetical protein
MCGKTGPAHHRCRRRACCSCASATVTRREGITVRPLPRATVTGPLFAVALVASACGASAAPTPVARVAGPSPAPAATTRSQGEPSATPSATTSAAPNATTSAAPTAVPSASPATGFPFAADVVVAYYIQAGGFACDDWAPAELPGHQQRSCELEDPANKAADETLVVTADPTNTIVDVIGIYEHRDGTTVDRAAALKFFASLVGATFGVSDGPEAAVWLKAHLGAADATFELRGLRLDTFLPDGESALGSQLFIEIATPAYRAAT